MKRALKHTLLTFLGRPVRCELCGAELFRAIPVIRRGALKLQGAEGNLVRVDFDSMNHLVFRHVEADRCAAPRA